MSSRPSVVINSKSGNTPCTTIDLRLHIGNDTRENILEAVNEAVADFKLAVQARLQEIGKIAPKERIQP